MTRYVVIENNTVANVIEANDVLDGFNMIQSDTANIGDMYANGVFTPPAPPAPPVPLVISDRQFFQQLAVVGTITQEEALAAVKTGAIPAALSGFLSSLPPADQFSAEMLLSGATEFHRNHPLTAAVGSAQGMTSEQIDAFFIAANAL